MPQLHDLRRRARALPLREAAPASLLLATLKELGWHRSVVERSPMTAGGDPLPWWTYPTIRMLDLALRPEHQVFEFGSGGSTAWLADRVQQVSSVEHDPVWEAKVRAQKPANAALVLAQSRATDSDADPDDPYLAPLQSATEDFDLIVVDGLGRNRCCELAVSHLAPDGLILLDDSDRVTYRPAHETLRAQGFGRIDFYGPRPGVGHVSVTSLFGRDFTPWTRDLPPPDPSGY